MDHPFIRNHQYNFIKKQVGLLQHTGSTVSDPRVVQSVRDNAHFKIIEAFPDANAFQKQVLEKISALHTTEDFQNYLESLEHLLTEFPRVTENQMKKLFPKVKKLKVPDLSAIDHRYVTYLGWVDISTEKMFLVYPMNGEWTGIEGRFTPSNKGICFLCNKHEDVALFTAVTKGKPAHASPDYYKAVGNYLCINSEVCNKNITDVTALEKFIQTVAGS